MKTDVLLSLDFLTGGLRRYECGSGKPRLTHLYPSGPKAFYTWEALDVFAVRPPEHYKVEETVDGIAAA